MDCITRPAHDGEVRERLQSLKCKWLAAVGYSIGALFGASAGSAQDAAVAARAEEAVDCVQRQVAFDGITPLHYATVNGVQRSNAHLHKQYPAQCGSSDESACPGESNLAAGTIVAIAKTCGQWAFVQHIGAESLITGWLSSSRLRDRQARLPFDAGEPGGRKRQPWWHPPTTIRVALIKGRGVPVCEAYLQRINQTMFYEPPYCSRPDNDQVPGFTRLERKSLPAAVANSIYVQAFNISHPTFDNNQLRPPELPTENVVAIHWLNGTTQKMIPALTSHERLSVWSFDPSVDIENNGRPDDVVIWRGFPPVWHEDVDQSACGDSAPALQGAVSAESYAFILNQGGRDIDVAKTAAVFGDPVVPPAFLAARKFPKGSLRIRSTFRLARRWISSSTEASSISTRIERTS